MAPKPRRKYVGRSGDLKSRWRRRKLRPVGLGLRHRRDGTADVGSVIEHTKVTKAMEMTLHKTALKIVTIVNQHKDHIPPITTSEVNPFPYQINLNPKIKGWAKTVGMY